jgi:ABC-type multidrug transport system ATPase subunit
MTNAIEVENLCKAYQEFALADVCFTVPQGRCCGLVGPNGAGKMTTTLRIMAGLSYIVSSVMTLLGVSYGLSVHIHKKREF